MQKTKIILVSFFIYIFCFLSLLEAEQEYLTLRNDKVNLRQGPSFQYPVKLTYKKKYLPILIEDKSDNFRKIRDHQNNSGWIHVSQLSKKKAALVIDEQAIIFKKSTIYSKPLAKLKRGRLCLIYKCRDQWCKVKVDKYKGWIKKESLKGKL